MNESKYSVFVNMRSCMPDDNSIPCDTLAQAKAAVAEEIRNWTEEPYGFWDGHECYSRYYRWEAMRRLRASHFTLGLPITVGHFERSGIVHEIGFALNIVRNW